MNPVSLPIIRADLPLNDLEDALDHLTGFSLGILWRHDREDYSATRTLLEYNDFPESYSVGCQKKRAYAKN